MTSCSAVNSESPSVAAPFQAPGRWTAAAIPDQSGRLALITGANSGLGLEAARALAARGAAVVLACRSASKAERARAQLLEELAREPAGQPHGPLDVLNLDLADLDSVVAAAATVAERYGRLDLLINNAGVMAPPRQLTRQGFELQFGTNHLGHHALTRLLLPWLERQAGARVVQVSSGAQYFGRLAFDDLQGERHYDRWRAYSQSKLANVVLARELQRRPGAAAWCAWRPIPVWRAQICNQPRWRQVVPGWRAWLIACWIPCSRVPPWGPCPCCTPPPSPPLSPAVTTVPASGAACAVGRCRYR